MTTFNEAHGRKVVSTSTAETVGKIDAFVVDGINARVVALELKKTDDGDVLRWSDIVSFGPDAVTVAAADKITAPGDDLAPLLAKSNHVLKKRVLTTGGDELGEVKDVEFDAATGTVTQLHLNHAANGSDGMVAGSRIVGVGSYAVVVEAAAAPGGETPTTQTTWSPPAPPPVTTA